MITLLVDENNPITQSFYDDSVNSIDLKKLSCPTCNDTGSFRIHAYYRRSIKTESGKRKLKLCRVRCSHCGRTHTIMLSSIIPYSQTPLKEHVKIIQAFESPSPTAAALRKSGSISDESTMRHIIRRYIKHWKHRLSEKEISISHIHSLISSCFRYFQCQFMQIKDTKNVIAANTT